MQWIMYEWDHMGSEAINDTREQGWCKNKTITQETYIKKQAIKH